jgi:DNA invertase Pin-like site-specific DNA recombinase
MGYEVSRLARNNADWHRLIELCALFDTLIGDSDGIYNPRDFNDRLVLGLKGTMSEAELHSLRLRLDAGRLSKAKRGELVQHVPTGLVRTSDGDVILDPDISVQERIRLVFDKFVEMGSTHKVLQFMTRSELKLPRRQTSGLYAGEVLWKDPSMSALYSILKNPAYAGAFAYGRRRAEPTKQVPGRPATGRLRQPRSRWAALVKDVYPAFVSWQEFEKIQQKIEENRIRMSDRMTRKSRVRSGAALLAGLVSCSRCGHTMRVAYKDNRYQYVCNGSRVHYGKSSCQFLSGSRIDAAVVEEFFNVLVPAQIDALESVLRRTTAHHHDQIKHLEQDMMRLEYEAKRAERQYDNVDPENRLIAASLEKKWEAALLELEKTRERLEALRATPPVTARIPDDLRESFANVGQHLPGLWPRLSTEAKKSMIRTIVERVNLLRDSEGVAQVRIVWRGGLVTETRVCVPVHSLQYSETEQKVANRIRTLTEAGNGIEQIVSTLNEEGFMPCRGGKFTTQIVIKLKKRYDIVSNLEHVRREGLSFAYTIKEIAALLDVDPSWVYRRIGDGTINVTKDRKYGCYLFPRTKRCVAQLQRLKKGTVAHVSFQKAHKDG